MDSTKAEEGEEYMKEKDKGEQIFESPLELVACILGSLVGTAVGFWLADVIGSIFL